MNEDAKTSPTEACATGKVEDSELLRRYVEAGSQEAFAELVRRRIGLVYSVALRQTHGDRHRAEDATQAVFTDLARKAPSLIDRPVLAGWLFRSAQFAAAGLVRVEQRRQAREREAHTMDNVFSGDGRATDWDKVRPVLDEVLSEIDERDRDAILLRFFDGRQFADIGARLRLTEGAARMRVERALDKLNAALARRGITSTSAALGVVLGHQIGVATPAGLAATVTGTAIAKAAAAGGWLAGFMTMSKLQIGIASAVAVAGSAGYIVQAETNAALREEMMAPRQQQQSVAALRSENQKLAALAREVEVLRSDDAELKRLAQSVANAQKASAENARLAQIRESQRGADQNTQAEIDRMNREGNKLVEEYRPLSARAKDPALTAEERAAADATAKLKLAQIQAKQREIQAFIAATRGTTPPQFKAVEGSRYVLVVDGTQSGQRPIADGGLVSLRLPKADHVTAFSALENVTGLKVIRDPSLANVTGTLDLETGVCTKLEAMQALGTALHQQLNIILVPNADGTIVAKLGAVR